MSKYSIVALISLTTVNLVACGKDNTPIPTAPTVSAQASASCGSTPGQTFTTPQSYCYSNFTPQQALTGQGSWITVDGIQYWVPPTQVVQSYSAEWMPYRNGYWTYVEPTSGAVAAQYGWTWISYDQWGWVTEHYGVWRHHVDHGWIWQPFPDLSYHASAVSWFYTGTYVGWYPYYADTNFRYLYTQSPYFNDGFWLHYNVNVGYGSAAYAYYPGFTYLHVNDFGSANVFQTVSTYTTVDFSVVVGAAQLRRYPGDSTVRSSQKSYAFMKVNSVAPVTTHAGAVQTAGGAKVLQPTIIAERHTAQPTPPAANPKHVVSGKKKAHPPNVSSKPEAGRPSLSLPSPLPSPLPMAGPVIGR